MKAAVIGSGMSGLIAAAVLAQAGAEVTVYEQYEIPGGVTAPAEQDGFKWDLGQLLVEGLAPEESIGRILAELGVLERISVSKEDRGYVFPDFAVQKPPQYQGVQWRIEQLKRMFPADAAGLERYWRDYLRFLKVMALGRKLETAAGVRKAILTIQLYATLLPLFPKKDWSAERLMADYFQSERLRCVFISILADFFIRPSEFLGLGVFALNHETFYDCRLPKWLAPNTEQTYLYNVHGGISTLANALVERILELGGKVYTTCTVKKIKVINNRVTAVVDACGVVYPADVVVASGGAQETFFDLVGEDLLPAEFVQAVREVPLMDSIFMVHLGIDFDPSPFVHGVCTYYYGTYDIENGVAEALNGRYHEGRDGFVVHIPSLHTPAMAPQGCHAMTIYTICPDTLAQGDWDACKEEYADKLVAYAEQRIPGLAAHTRTRLVMTPDDFKKRTHVHHHAFGGLAPKMGKKGVPHHTPVEGLWFVGAQSESGGGLPGVVPGAYRTAKRILQGNAGRSSAD
ncbi:MAG: NAD(P)/FAD-dependent oxidoreductase [Anaerolineae bacterium]|nr:NAD(P)/FAD-dependent oxidoreductase [Anaerolineae bacterium]